MEKVKKFFIELYHFARLPEMLILPGNLAFFLILSLIPLITLIGIITSILSLSTGSIVAFISNTLPSGVVNILLPFIDGSNISATNIVFVLLGFYIASNGPDSLITASNVLYKIKNESYVYRRIKALFMTFWFMLLFIFILVFIAFGNVILNYLLEFEFLANIIKNNYLIITIIKYFIAFLFILLSIKILYTIAPAKKIKSKYVNRGALFSTITIMVVTLFYSYYVTNIAHYDVMYGSLASIAILMFLIYLISYILMLGIAINRSYYDMDIITTDKIK